ncbi:histidine--tRNA ligase [Candidatus Kaiserbacteria bacterium]|nr:MAG: histidine--tRNA ligase [Candidatus Kaiserbacteria bacterium]
MTNKLSTEAYKGTRDFYPEDMAVQRYIFDTWSKTAESFGFARYDASILEPAELYRSKTSEEIVNEQTYTFIDRGEREVTLRPEMTPTVARMIAARKRDLSFPVRWYAIPNLFRYERPQRGRLREHWQLNCDMFGVNDIAAEIEMIALAYHTLTAFGATPDTFKIRLNDRALMEAWYAHIFHLDADSIRAVTRIVDRKHKVSAAEFKMMLGAIVPDTDRLIAGLDATTPEALREETTLSKIIDALKELGIANVVFDASLARGFDYYTGTIFEVFDTSPENSRSMLGGGRYNNLTGLFGGDAVSGIGFGMGDVVMKDFLLTHKLLPKDIHVTAPTLMVIPTDSAFNLESEKIAQTFRASDIRTAVDISDKKLAKKISAASDGGAQYVLVVGSDECASQSFILKQLSSKQETKGIIQDLVTSLTANHA